MTIVESVWDYPRPPRLEPTEAHVLVRHKGLVLADTRAALRVLETSHPPVFYLPPGDVLMQHLRPSDARQSFCEFKGLATYWDFVLDGSSVVSPEDRSIAWSYARPTPPFEALRDFLAFYPSRVEECRVNGERATAQPGDFYGGWITSHLRGPFKGGPGTRGW